MFLKVQVKLQTHPRIGPHGMGTTVLAYIIYCVYCLVCRVCTPASGVESLPTACGHMCPYSCKPYHMSIVIPFVAVRLPDNPTINVMGTLRGSRHWCRCRAGAPVSARWSPLTRSQDENRSASILTTCTRKLHCAVLRVA